MYIVYKHVNKANGKIYIGITCRTIKQRWRSGYYNNLHFMNAIKKYGYNGFTHEIVASNLTKEEAEKLEQLLILEFDCTNQLKGYNIERGGNHHGKHSLETKKKISQKQKGRKLTDEHKKKISEARKGYKYSPETLEKRRKRMLGNKYTLGFKHSEKTKKLMSEIHKGQCGKKVICLNDNKIYNTITSAAEFYGLNRHQVLNICRGKTKKIRNSELKFQYCEMEV